MSMLGMKEGRNQGQAKRGLKRRRDGGQLWCVEVRDTVRKTEDGVLCVLRWSGVGVGVDG